MALQISPYVIMIDNYDSFTWNIYQFLCQEGARCEVIRNDAITIEELAAKSPDILLILPGPGHPSSDSGISRDVIKYFSGRIPVFGVCMGQQCMFEVFGGNVEYAGEIVHGKTSPITHDGKGLFEGVPQNVEVTRYHSLAGTELSLPESLEITARTEGGVIMGVRHKEFTVEGVQFHPESILTEAGHIMVRNMLSVRGGKWKESPAAPETLAAPSSPSILDQIYAQRREDVAMQQIHPSTTFAQLEASYSMGIAPPLVDFHERLLQEREAGRFIVAAEIKRASPSKGDIALTVNAAERALTYANAGAATISVLTEPHRFKGSLDDLRLARMAVSGVTNRPAILRKEFVFSKYQILEARLAGADTVLLICKMLTAVELSELYAYSVLLGMEPLVEVSDEAEMRSAVALGSKVIGVNNRDLHSFEVDLSTTSGLVGLAGKGDQTVRAQPIVLALSGVTGIADARKYESEGVSGVLVGEALMRVTDVTALVQGLRGVAE